jgi:ArsR family transcriptional regulator
MDVLEEPQSKISRHLSYLKHSGLAYSKRVGVWMHYGLRETKNDPRGRLIHFLKEELLPLPQCRHDIDRLNQLKHQGRCKSDRKVLRPRSSRSVALSH